MELKLIQRLVRIMQDAEISDLELDDSKEGFRLRIQRGPKPVSASAPVVHVTQAGAVPNAPMLAPPAAAPAPAAPSGPPPGTKPFTSPMVGTFYRSPSPDSEPFVQVGKVIKPDSVICIIEAMKVMNEIKAECSGTIVEILAENGQAVEFGQPLFLVKSA
jgi:acetyl-CoA carboxylase biotin carboxyl carrier protein